MGRKELAGNGLHSVVAALIASGDSHRTLLDVPEPRGQLLDTTLMLVESAHGKVSPETALAEAERVPPTGHDPNLYLFFLGCWIAAAHRVGRIAEMASLLARAKSLINSWTPPELRAGLLMDESLLAATLGNMAEHERLLRLALDGVSRESGNYSVLYISLARFLAWMGRGKEMAAGLDDLPEAKRRRHASGIAATRMVDAAICGRMNEAARFLKVVPSTPTMQAFYGTALEAARGMLRLILRHWETPDTAAAREELAGQPFLNALEEERPDWERLTELLAERRTDEALTLARKMAAEGVEHFLNEYGFDAYGLVRAELSAGNGDAGRRVIEIRRRRGNRQYLDDLFLARAELLAGRSESAFRHYAAVSDACERYDALNRLEFELHLSCELSAGQAAWLVREAAGLKGKRGAARRAPAAPAASGGGDGESSLGAVRLLGKSATMAKVRDAVARLATLDAPVLLTGETGTGKELVARAIHGAGPRAPEPFVAVNCGAISEGLLESELFGHEKGAFTGAERAHRGFFEEAGAGTILLDEIGEMPPRLQVALLRVLESGEIRPVGSARARKIVCRVIAATNADLDAMVADGRFRQDLLYRLRRLEITIPPLRDRREDIVPLAEAFLNEDRADGQRAGLAPGLAAVLRAREWRGNVRELRNAMERMRLLNSDKPLYDAGDLEPEEAGAGEGALEAIAPAGLAAPAGGKADGPASGEDSTSALAVLGSERTMLRQLERLRDLFGRHRRLTRKEIIRILEVAPATAAKYLRELCAEGAVEKVMPSASPRSHYFRVRTPPDEASGATMA